MSKGNNNKNNTNAKNGGVQARKSKKKQTTQPKTEKFESVLQHDLVKEDGLTYDFVRAVKVPLPNGSTRLLVLQDEVIRLNFEDCRELIPNVLRILDRENGKCPEFTTQSKPTLRHSVESKLFIYIDGLRDTHLVTTLIESLTKSEIISTPPKQKDGEK